MVVVRVTLEKKSMQRDCSAFTTPRSARGTDSHETERFGDGNVTDTEETDQGSR